MENGETCKVDYLLSRSRLEPDVRFLKRYHRSLRRLEGKGKIKGFLGHDNDVRSLTYLAENISDLVVESQVRTCTAVA